MTPQHHPSEELLLDYATGALFEPVALAVATHMAFCPLCRAESAHLDCLGGTMLNELSPEVMAENSLECALARLDAPIAGPEVPPAAAGNPRLPRPLRDYMDGRLDELGWRNFGALSEARLMTGVPGFTTRLVRLKPGKAAPRHTHEGHEYTVVLTGAYTDLGEHYLRGDFAVADPSVDHQPAADPGEECLCLAVTDAPLRLTGRFGRLLNPLARI